MIEVLITIVILAIGLLGLAGLQSRLQASEMEAYQRAQALILLNDMASRLSTNRAKASTYVTGATGTDSPLGAGMTCPTDTSNQQQVDAGEWCDALQGAGEISSGDSKVGAMLGGRGCIESLGGSAYRVTVAWQGLTPISAPPDAVACGKDSYDTADTACTSDRCRRVLTTIVRIAKLD
jgi:type IV pilus assembly protein PilV